MIAGSAGHFADVNKMVWPLNDPTTSDPRYSVHLSRIASTVSTSIATFRARFAR